MQHNCNVEKDKEKELELEKKKEIESEKKIELDQEKNALKKSKKQIRHFGIV